MANIWVEEATGCSASGGGVWDGRGASKPCVWEWVGGVSGVVVVGAWSIWLAIRSGTEAGVTL